jgi:ABC-type transport system involved in cytochrome c biogenesis permease subunit
MSRSIRLLIAGAIWLAVRYRAHLRYAHLVALGLVLLFVGYLVYAMLPVDEPPKSMQLREFGNLFVQDNGRIKPFDTLARVSLLIISSRQSYYDENGKEHPAVEWLLDVATSTAHARKASVQVKAFRIDDAKVRAALGLKDRSPPLYSYEEMGPDIGSLLAAMRDRISSLGPEDDVKALRTQFMELVEQLQAYESYAPYETPHKIFRIDNDQLLAMLGLELRSGFRYSFDEFVPRMAQLINEAKRIKRVPEQDRSAYQKKTWEFIGHVQLYAGLANLHGEFLQVVPPLKPDESWRTLQDAIREQEDEGKSSPAVDSLRNILKAYADGDAGKFNQAVADYRQLQDKALPGQGGMARFEVFFNHFEPFYQCTLLYVAVFLFACASWIGWSDSLRTTAFWLCVLTLALHTSAIVARIVLQGRPPVTNLYSSAVFVGWGCVGLGLFLEWFFPYGIAVAAGAILGFLTNLLAIHLAGSGDTLEMMQAVLDTNFWLATHVTAVTLGYAATLLAGVVGVLYIAFGLIGKPGNASVLKIVSTIVYGIVCFATLFSFTGTVLGGIWADQSWGRFWGWDPKENGALIIVVWNALLLHARWAGMIKQRGIAVLSVVGIMVTIWSWIGTNQLEIGLHAYGFNSTLAKVARYTWGASLMVILVGSLTPLRYWRALRPAPALEAPPTKARLRPA